MHILITAATGPELSQLATFLEDNFSKIADNHFAKNYLQISLCITGVGAAITTFHLCNQLGNNHYDLVLQLGIAGAYNHQLNIGDVVVVKEEFWGDLGAEDHNGFLDIFDLQLANADDFPYQNKALLNQQIPSFFNAIKNVKSLTVNCSSGNQKTIDKRIRKYSCDVESMEGAAFHYVCLQKNMPFIQLRAISNLVTPRNKADWNIPLAISNVNQCCVDFLNSQIS